MSMAFMAFDGGLLSILHIGFSLVQSWMCLNFQAWNIQQFYTSPDTEYDFAFLEK